MLRKTLLKVASNYLIEKNSEFTKNPFANYMRHEIKTDLDYLIENNLMIASSPGKGGWTDTPWIGIFDNRITNSAQFGYYPVYLFSADMKKVYLSLNQDYTFYDKNFKSTDRKSIIKKINSAALHLLRINKKNYKTTIDLHSTNKLSKGYQLCNIFAFEYEISKLPNDK